MAERNEAGLTDSHKRAYASTLALVDEALCEFERWASGQAARGVMYQEVNDLSPGKRRELQAGILSVRKTMEDLREKLGLKPETASVSHKIWVLCSGFWEPLVELEGSYLKRFGALAPKQVQELDALVTRINRQFQGLSAKVRSKEAPVRAKDGGR